MGDEDGKVSTGWVLGVAGGLPRWAERGLEAAARDEDERAVAAIERGGRGSLDATGRALRFLIASRLRERGGVDVAVGDPSGEDLARLAAEAPELCSLVHSALSRQARWRGDLPSASALAATAERLAGPGSEALLLARRERAENDLQGGRGVAALIAAARALEGAGLEVEAARTFLRVADAGVPTDEAPAVWVSRAQRVLTEKGSHRDRTRVRAAMRVHGRRTADRALVDATLASLSSLDRSTSRVSAEVGVLVDEGGGAVASARLAREAQAALAELGASARQLEAALTASAAQRLRVNELFAAINELSLARGAAELCARSVRRFARLLGADRAVIVRSDDGVLTVVASTADVPSDAWREPVVRALGDAPPSTRRAALVTPREATAQGPVLAIALRAPSFEGAIYADRQRLSRAFDDAELEIGGLFAAWLSQTVGLEQAHDAEKQAAAELEATLSSVRDGILSVDAAGVVRTANSTARRVLIEGGPLVGRRLADIPGLDDLASELLPPRRIEGLIIELPRGSIVLSARPIEHGGQQKGVVATIVELDRAQRLAARVSAARARYTFADVQGNDPRLREAVALARKAADLDASVLITGESGTGKEVLAQAIHTGGRRANEPFVGINCAALPRELLEAELFGHERGAFTGARADGAPGKFELAGEGTLLLDEIGDMPLDMQAKLLRVLQERVVVRLGASRERRVRARIIATTHRDLDLAVSQGDFRLDLLFRLRVLHLRMPALRERPDDIEPLALSLLTRVAAAQRKRVGAIDVAVLEQLRAHSFPGNVRELVNVIEREVSLLSPDAPRLTRLQLPLGAPRAAEPSSPEPKSAKRPVVAAAVEAASSDAIVPMAEVERRAFLEALAACEGHVGKASKALGVSQSSFYQKLRSWGVAAAEERSPASLRKLAVTARRSRDG